MQTVGSHVPFAAEVSQHPAEGLSGLVGVKRKAWMVGGKFV